MNIHKHRTVNTVSRTGALPLLITTLILAFSGCQGAGGDGTGADAATETRTIGFDEDISGYILLSSTGTPFAYPTEDGASGEVLYIAAGDGPFDQVERGFVSFDLDIPAAATEIVSAELNIYLNQVANDPYAELGGELNAHGVDYGGSLSDFDYYSVPGEGPFTLSSDTADEDSWISADVTAAVAEDFNDGETRTQFLLKFPIDNNGDLNPQGVDLEADGSDPDTPYLVIEYRR